MQANDDKLNYWVNRLKPHYPRLPDGILYQVASWYENYQRLDKKDKKKAKKDIESWPTGNPLDDTVMQKGVNVRPGTEEEILAAQGISGDSVIPEPALEELDPDTHFVSRTESCALHELAVDQ